MTFRNLTDRSVTIMWDGARITLPPDAEPLIIITSSGVPFCGQEKLGGITITRLRCLTDYLPAPHEGDYFIVPLEVALRANRPDLLAPYTRDDEGVDMLGRFI